MGSLGCVVEYILGEWGCCLGGHGFENLWVSCNVIRFSTIEVEGMNKDIHIAYCIGIIDRFIISTVRSYL